MAASDAISEYRGRARKVRALIAAIDLMVEQKLDEIDGHGIDHDLDMIWRSGAIFVRRPEFDWLALAGQHDINPPSEATRRDVLDGLDERVRILNRRARPGNVVALRR